MWKILQRNRRLVAGAVITESRNDETGQRRYSATIDGWQNWRILIVSEPIKGAEVLDIVTSRVRQIRDRIRSGDETVFWQPDQAW